MTKRVLSAVVAGLLIAAPAPARADPDDPWFGRDKALHFGLSVGLSAGGYAAASCFTESVPWRAGVGAGFSLSLGVAKEAHDMRAGGQASYRDLTWDFAGTAVGVLLSLLVDQATRPSPHPSRGASSTAPR